MGPQGGAAGIFLAYPNVLFYETLLLHCAGVLLPTTTLYYKCCSTKTDEVVRNTGKQAEDEARDRVCGAAEACGLVNVARPGLALLPAERLYGV